MSKPWVLTEDIKRQRAMRRLVSQGRYDLARLLLNSNGRTHELARQAYELGLRHGRRFARLTAKGARGR